MLTASPAQRCYRAAAAKSAMPTISRISKTVFFNISCSPMTYWPRPKGKSLKILGRQQAQPLPSKREKNRTGYYAGKTQARETEQRHHYEIEQKRNKKKHAVSDPYLSVLVSRIQSTEGAIRRTKVAAIKSHNANTFSVISGLCIALAK